MPRVVNMRASDVSIEVEVEVDESDAELRAEVGIRVVISSTAYFSRHTKQALQRYLCLNFTNFPNM